MRNIEKAGIAVLAASAMLVMTGCSAVGGGAGEQVSVSSTPRPPAKTYSAAEVSSILTAARSTLGITGQVMTLTQAQADLKKTTGASGLFAILSASGTTVAPKACGDLVKEGLSATPPAGTFGSLVVTKDGDTLTVATVAGKQLPEADKRAAASARLTDALATCSSMTISVNAGGQSLKISMTLKKTAATTDADSTTSIEEAASVTVGSQSMHMTTDIISAVYGNLLVEGDQIRTSLMPATAGPSPAGMVNAVVAAAKARAK